MTPIELPAGTYQIGDLCYLQDEYLWEQILETQEGKLGKLGDGRLFVYMPTAYGDGVYTDNHGEDWYVDSGTIGILRSFPNDPEDVIEYPSPMGRTVFFKEPFNVYEKDGVLYFGDIWIATAYDE
jgi:hypothetical protein